MASARCAYCDATLQPNSMYCLECGQLIPQQPVRPPVPAQFAKPATATDVPKAAPKASSSRIEPVPLPGTLPWQQRSGSNAEGQRQQVAAPAAEPAPRARFERVELLFSTGQRVMVAGSAVIGRKPADTALAMGVQAIEVADDTRSVSRVHLFLDVADSVIMVGDAGSSNGSGLERDGSVMPLESAGTRVEARPGDTVWVGDISFAIQPA